MSGLIWAGIGKGIADAGTTFGSYMLKDIEDQRRREDDERREANAIKRAEESTRIKEESDARKAEDLRQRVIKETAQAQQRATEIGTERAGRRDATAASTKLGELASMAGEPVNTFGKEQLLEQIRKDPALRESFRKQGLIDGAAEPTRDARLERADDLFRAAREIGAHSSVLDAYAKDRRDTLDEIRRENDKREGDQRYQATMAAIAQRDRATDERGRQFDEKKPIEQQQADAATTRANRPTGGGGGGGSSAPKVRSTKTDSNGDEIAIMSDGTTKDLGIKSAVFDSRVANTISAMEKSDYNFRQLPEEEKRKRAVERLAGGPRPASTPAPSPSSSSNRPPLNSFIRK